MCNKNIWQLSLSTRGLASRVNPIAQILNQLYEYFVPPYAAFLAPQILNRLYLWPGLGSGLTYWSRSTNHNTCQINRLRALSNRLQQPHYCPLSTGLHDPFITRLIPKGKYKHTGPTCRIC